MPAITCGWCQTYTNTEIASKITSLKQGSNSLPTVYVMTATFICISCGNHNIARWVSYEETSDVKFVDWAELTQSEAIRWYPPSGSNKEFEDVPEIISEAASEAWKCHASGCYRAAIIMARSVVEAAAKAKGGNNGTLAQKISYMNNEGLIRPALATQLNEIRYIGNESAHGDLNNEITSTDSSEVLELLAELLNELWQAPARAERLRQRRLMNSGKTD